MIPSVSAAPQMPSAGRINPSGPIQLDCDVLFSGAIRATPKWCYCDVYSDVHSDNLALLLSCCGRMVGAIVSASRVTSVVM